MVRKKLDALRKTESEIFIFGTRDSSYVAASLLWSLGRSPTAFITNSKQELDSSRFGIPILTPTAALAGRISPIIFICSYNQKTSQKLRGQVEQLHVENPVFIFVDELERLYLEEKRKTVELSKVQDLLGALDVPCHSISTYMCSVEGDYKCAWEDIQYVSSHVQAIKTLDIRTPSRLIDSEFVAFVQKIASLNNVIYINVKTDPYCVFPTELLNKLKKCVGKFSFWNFPTASHIYGPQFENLIGCIPYSYTEKEAYQLQTIGHDPQPLTIKNLKAKIAADLEIEILGSSVGEDHEICFVDIRDGLTDQMFSYFTACLISENTSKMIIIDDTYNHLLGKPTDSSWKELLWLHYNSCSNISRETIEEMVHSETNMSLLFYKRLELYEIFSCRFQLFSELFEKPVWEKLLSRLRQTTAYTPLLRYLSELNCRMTYYEGDHYDLIPINAPNYISINSWAADYFAGTGKTQSNFWLTAPLANSAYYLMLPAKLSCWNTENRRWAQQQLSFPPIEDEYNQNILAQIMDSDAVVMHVRRGDYCYLNPSLTHKSEAYYRAALAAVGKLPGYPNKKYFIFSDNIQWCREHERELGLNSVANEIIYVEQNIGAKSFRDLQLLSMGKIMIQQ